MPITALVAIAIFSLGAILSFVAAITIARETNKKNRTKVMPAQEDDPDIAGIVLDRLAKK